MRSTEHAVSNWHAQQEFKLGPAWKLLSAAPWVIAFFRAEFTPSRQRIRLEQFHAGLEAFLKELRRQEVPLNAQWQAANYADAWVRSQFLARPMVDGRFVYEPTAATARVITFIDALTDQRTNLNSSRLNTLLTSIESLAHETDPDPEARIRQLEAEIAERQAQIRALQSGQAPELLSRDSAVAAARSVLDLAASLPADFKRMRDGVEAMLHTIRQEIMESSMTKGVAVGQVLEGDRQLRSTAEGETFRGFTEFLNDPQQQARFRQAVTEVLERDFVGALTAGERATLSNLVRELRRQASEVHAIYGRLSESLHTYVQSDEFRESLLLRKAIRTAELAVAQSPALKARTPVAPLQLFKPRFRTLAGLGIFDPREHVPPPKLADPPALSEADIHRTPSTPKADFAALRSAVAVARAARRRGTGTAPTLGEVLEQLPPEQRHINSIRGLVLTARNTGQELDGIRYEVVTFHQVDGTERTAYLPLITFTEDVP
ncbi:DUF3375 domain-containing protein [Arthrobacter sp. GCM10027362]|uniref:DUF3375 domain-containing protein n=1 Tax=Arthrobacter sp. GCM10027362 TaxID=3273379 RepID=UPI003632EC89